MSYHQDSIAQITFTCPWGGMNTFLDPSPPKNNNKLAVLMASNCHDGKITILITIFFIFFLHFFLFIFIFLIFIF